MVFSSLLFLIKFLPMVFLIYFIAPKKFKNLILLLFSLLFYFVGEQKLVLLMLFSATVNFIIGLLIDKIISNKFKKLLLFFDIAFNLMLLGHFKYIDLLIETINNIFNTSFDLLKITLPIGISFYTFQTMSYVIDIYREKYKPSKNIINFYLYVTFFPQLIAGPIVRYEDIMNEIEDRKVSVDTLRYGIILFILGLSKKVLISNSLAEVTKLYLNITEHTLVMSWINAICVPLQIYTDFSGYSDIAVGLGKMFGFNFPKNFDFPFISKSVTEFWRRWHITLGSWFRDYVYIPLGGNKVKVFRHIINILIVWFLTGLWHGASYNFIIWGLYYGILLIFEKYFYGKRLSKHKIWSHVYLVIATILGFEIFSASDMSEIVTNVSLLFGFGTSRFSDVMTKYYFRSNFILIIISIIVSTPLIKNIIGRNKENFLVDLICILLFILCIAYLVDGSYNPFLYFRF